MQAPQCKHMHEMLVKEHHRFTPVFLKDVERHCERCAHLPHKSLKDVNLYFEITKVCVFQNGLLRLSGFCVGGAHIFQYVFQHPSQKQGQNRYLSSVCFPMVNNNVSNALAGWLSGWLAAGLAGWLLVRLTGWLACWRAGWLVVWLAGWLGG